MPTQCNTKPLEFEAHGNRRVVADFDGGPIASDAGLLPLRRVDRHLSVSDQVADSFTQAHPQPLHEWIYCARGEMENRIKEQQLDLFADRSAGTYQAVSASSKIRVRSSPEAGRGESLVTRCWGRVPSTRLGISSDA